MRSVIATAVLLAVSTGSAGAQTPKQLLIQRGDYLVNAVMSCNNCHTPRGPKGPDMAKMLSGGMTFDEPEFKVTASNITPDEDTGIGKWSDADIRKLLRTGLRPNGEAVAAIMPTAFYVALTERDLDAIVAYLRSIPAVKNETPAPEYRIKQPRPPAPLVKAAMTEADQIDPVKHGRYLAAIAHCLECHTPRDNGKINLKRIGAGGVEFTGPFGKSTSANITRNKELGIGTWSDDDIKRAITQGIGKNGDPLKPPMNFAGYAKMTPQDLSALVAFVKTLPARK
ncbi:MAG: c-type cytochrome [Afipia sp.]|nr:c-type cytochrome [Afipia sp.]